MLGPVGDELFQTGPVTTMPAEEENSVVSVDSPGAPSDIIAPSQAAVASSLAVLSISGDNNSGCKKAEGGNILYKLEKLANEILIMILKYVMTATNQIFDFSDKVGIFKPNITTGVLRVRYINQTQV